jgi:carboxylate-amine ligase
VQPISRAEDVLAALPPAMAGHTSAETHGSALELATAPHGRVGDAVAELGRLRAGLMETLRPLGIAAAAAGTHPLARWEQTEVSPGARYQYLHDSLRELARREPTFGLHIHVAVPDAEMATRALNRMGAHLPLLLALSANSPYWQGRDTGLASARTPLFQAFPRVGIPRVFSSYADWVRSVDLLIASDALEDHTYLWWDVRLQPRWGTVEIRIMDAQVSVEQTSALVALVQSLVRLEVLEGYASSRVLHAQEVLEENRFLAARDGAAAELIDPDRGTRVPLAEIVEDVVDACMPHAVELGCADELALVRELVRKPSAAHQRQLAGEDDDQRRLVEALADEFCPAAVPASTPG